MKFARSHVKLKRRSDAAKRFYERVQTRFRQKLVLTRTQSRFYNAFERVSFSNRV